jgi:S-(hydroxymethyl)glutathione dehydrogenase/alcohol dehydrogenase
LKTAAFAERALVHRSQIVTIAPDLPFEVAALLACGVITGYGAVANSARLRSGTDVVVIGAGGVGLNSIQAAAILGAGRILAIDLSPERLDAAKAFGATHGIVAGDDAVNAVFEMTDGRGADYVFVAVGAKQAIDLSYRLLAPGGMAVLVGIPENDVTSTFDPVALAGGSQQVVGSKLGAVDIGTDIPKLIELYREGRLKLDALITGRFPFENINQAIAATRAGRGLKNVLLFGDAEIS